MLLTDRQIETAIEQGHVTIDPFDQRSLQPASYDMRLGEEAITSTYRAKVNPAAHGLLTIPAGDFALVTTLESVKLSNRHAGHIGLRSHYARKGLVLLSGPQIDPGFEGALVLGLTNLSPSDIVIPYEERFCTIEFYELNEDVKTPYAGEYQRQSGISGRDLEALIESQGITFGQVITTLNTLNADVKALSDSVATLKGVLPIGIGIMAAISAIGIGIIAAIVAVA